MKADIRSSDIKAGLLVLLAMIIFFGFFFMIAGIGFKDETKQFVSRFGNSNGIQAGTVVRVGGVLVGKVDRVYFPEDDATRIEVLLTVNASAPVKQNSVAFITSIGIMGDYYVEITPGTLESALLPDGSILQSKDVPSLTQFGAQMAEPFERITSQLEEMLVNVNKFMSEKNSRHISNMIASLDTMILQNQGNANEITKNMVKLTENLQVVTDRLDRMMDKNSDNLSNTLEGLNSSMIHADSLLVELVKTISQLNYMLTSNETSFYEVLENLQNATDNFQTFSRKLKEQPWSLIRKSPLPKRQLPKN
jgi:phospholipid/cholesterol/gamma-HCH transport system substrate-binding protein